MVDPEWFACLHASVTRCGHFQRKSVQGRTGRESIPDCGRLVSLMLLLY